MGNYEDGELRYAIKEVKKSVYANKEEVEGICDNIISFINAQGLSDIKFCFYSGKVISFIYSDAKTIYLNLYLPDLSKYNDDIWRVNSGYEMLALILLHEVGHYKCGHKGRSSAQEAFQYNMCEKLKDEHEGEAWRWAFNFRKANKSLFDGIINDLKNLVKYLCKKDRIFLDLLERY